MPAKGYRLSSGYENWETQTEVVMVVLDTVKVLMTLNNFTLLLKPTAVKIKQMNYHARKNKKKA